MTLPDPIASATLARLYLSQGHWVRARAILDEVLARTPLDGDALALRARFERPRPRLSATLDGDRFCLRWQGVAEPSQMHVVATLWCSGPHPRAHVTSRPCTGAFGQHHLPSPWARGVLVACVGRVEAQGYAPVVVAEPLGWG